MDSELSPRKRRSSVNEGSIDTDLSKLKVVDDEEEEDEATKKRRALENDIRLPVIVFLLTVFFPPLGFVFFLMNKSLNRSSRRYLWFQRALGLGSALSVIYALIIASVLHHTVLYKDADDELGYGYE